MSSFALAEKFKNHSQVESIFRLSKTAQITEGISLLVEVEGNDHRLNNFYAASSNILDFITLDVVAGDISQALAQPGQLVLSEREAIRLLGSTQVDW